LVVTLLELAGTADELLVAGLAEVLLLAGAWAVLLFAGAGLCAGTVAGLGGCGGKYSGPLLPQPAIAANARQAGSSRIIRRMVRDSSGFARSIAKL
jgi:hypothetical protein